MEMAVHEQPGPESLDQPEQCGEALVGRVGTVPDAKRWGVRNEHIQSVSGEWPAEPEADFQPEGSPPHFRLRVLVGTPVVSDRAAQPGDPESRLVGQTAVHVDAAGRSPRLQLECLRDVEGGGAWPEIRVVVARHVEERHVQRGDEEVEIAVGEIAASEDQVGSQLEQARAVQAFLDLVSDSQNSCHKQG